MVPGHLDRRVFGPFRAYPARIGPTSPHIAVVGAGRASRDQEQTAEAVGGALAEAGAVLVCGGLGGVMEAACRGARAAGGTTVGILPGSDRSAANEHVDVAIATGLGEARNALVVRAVDALIAIGGEFGTLSEIALALKAAKPVVGLGTWDLEPIVRAQDPVDAVRRALELAA
jgi:uncharacterized protein (TIGR00725 family)